MAEQLALVKTYDFESDQSSVTLLWGTHGFEPAYGGWTPEVAPSRARNEFVSEAITVRINRASTDGIATSLQLLADKAVEAQRYFENGARDYAVWFRVQFDGESKGRQSLVKEVRHEPASSVFDKALRASYHWNKYIVGIDRYPWWEGTACGTITGATVNTVGGTISFGTINGDLNGRIAQLKVTNMGTHAIWPAGQVWIGVKSNRYGTVAGTFQSFWSFKGTCLNTDFRLDGGNLSTADATAKGGTARLLSITGAGTSLNTPYFMGGISLAAVTNKPEIHKGDYRVLLRAKTDGTAQFLVRLKTGWLYDWYYNDPGEQPVDTEYPNAKAYPRVSIEYPGTDPFHAYGNAWHLYELGDVTIPPSTHIRGQQGSPDLFSLLLYAERISGTKALWIDGFVLIPKEGFVYAGNINQYTTQGGGTSLFAVQSPDGVLQAEVMEQADTGYGTIPSWTNVSAPVFVGGMPTGTGGIIIVAADSKTKSLINTNVAVEIKYFERWKEMRGND